VRGELVSLEAFAGVQGSISLAQLGEILERLGRNAPPDRRASDERRVRLADRTTSGVLSAANVQALP
jgi:hypothetical protein